MIFSNILEQVEYLILLFSLLTLYIDNNISKGVKHELKHFACGLVISAAAKFFSAYIHLRDDIIHSSY